jgi:hypothetical protein
MTFVEIIEEIRDRLGMPTSATHTRMIKAAVKAEYRAACAERNYRFLVKTGTVALTAIGTSFALPVDFRSCALAALLSNSAVLRPQHFLLDAMTNGNPATRPRGVPTSYDVFKAGLGTGFVMVPQPLPLVADTVHLWYIATPADLALNADVPIFQSDFHGILVEGGLMRLGAADSFDANIAAVARAERDRLVAGLMIASPVLPTEEVGGEWWGSMVKRDAESAGVNAKRNSM